MEVVHDAAAEIRRLAVGRSASRAGAAGPMADYAKIQVFGTARRWSAGFLGLLALAAGSGATARAETVGSYYTEAQAAAGEPVFAQQCAICHGENLQGKVGPALAGKLFLSVSQYQELTAAFLYRVMSRQMPKNDPGSLSKTQYLDVLAYILKVNGYPAGSQKLTADEHELSQIKIEPTGKTQENNTKEDQQ